MIILWNHRSTAFSQPAHSARRRRQLALVGCDLGAGSEIPPSMARCDILHRQQHLIPRMGRRETIDICRQYARPDVARQAGQKWAGAGKVSLSTDRRVNACVVCRARHQPHQLAQPVQQWRAVRERIGARVEWHRFLPLRIDLHEDQTTDVQAVFQ